MRPTTSAAGIAALLSLLAATGPASASPSADLRPVSLVNGGSSPVSTLGLDSLLSTSGGDRDGDRFGLRLLDGLGLGVEERTTATSSALRAVVLTDAERLSSPPLVDVTAQSSSLADRDDSSLVVGLPQVDGLKVQLQSSSDNNRGGLDLDVSTETGRARDESLLGITLRTDQQRGDGAGSLALKVDLLEGVLGGSGGRADANAGNDCGLVNLGSGCQLLDLGGDDGLLGLGGNGGGLLGLGGNGNGQSGLGGGGLLGLGGSGNGLLGLGGNGEDLSGLGGGSNGLLGLGGGSGLLDLGGGNNGLLGLGGGGEGLSSLGGGGLLGLGATR